jgi:hypothetical protein
MNIENSTTSLIRKKTKPRKRMSRVGPYTRLNALIPSGDRIVIEQTNKRHDYTPDSTGTDSQESAAAMGTGYGSVL